mgnify:CR=1 FL=1
MHIYFEIMPSAETRLIDLQKTFGEYAGRVQKVLEEHGSLTARDIARLTGLRITDVFGGIGWLARDGKVSAVEYKRRILYRLNL